MLRDEGEPGNPAARLDVKVVPGARRDQIAGPLGDRLKVRVSAPPEDGRANKAVCGLIAGVLGLRASEVTVIAGPASPEKTLRIAGRTAEQVRAALGL